MHPPAAALREPIAPHRRHRCRPSQRPRRRIRVVYVRCSRHPRYRSPFRSCDRVRRRRSRIWGCSCRCRSPVCFRWEARGTLAGARRSPAWAAAAAGAGVGDGGADADYLALVYPSRPGAGAAALRLSPRGLPPQVRWTVGERKHPRRQSRARRALKRTRPASPLRACLPRRQKRALSPPPPPRAPPLYSVTN